MNDITIKRSRRLGVTLLVLAFAFIAYVVTGSHVAWVHPETANVFFPSAIRFSFGFSWNDFAQAFNYWDFDRPPRARFVSHLLQIWTVHTRLWLFDLIPPIFPSLSVAWAMSLFGTPWLIYRITARSAESRLAGVVAAALFLVSIASLSTLAVWFHPAKPATIFFAALAIDFGQRLESTGDAKSKILFWLGIGIAATLGFFSDEKAWFIFPALGLVCPALFFRAKEGSEGHLCWTAWARRLPSLRLAVIAGWFALFGALVASLVFVIPKITMFLGIGDFPFFEFASPSGTVGQMKLESFFLNADALVRDVFSLGDRDRDVPVKAVQLWGRLGAVAMIGALAFFARKAPLAQRRHIANFTAAAVFFIIFHALIQTRHAAVQGAYYYGSLFCLFTTIPLAIILVRQSIRWPAMILLALIVGLGIYNFFEQNDSLRRAHFPIYRLFYVEDGKVLKSDERLRTSMIHALWGKRDDLAALRAARAGLPLEGIWLYEELEAISLRRKGLDVVRGAPGGTPGIEGSEMMTDRDERSMAVWPSPREPFVAWQRLAKKTDLSEIRLRAGEYLGRDIEIVTRKSDLEEWKAVPARFTWPTSRVEPPPQFRSTLRLPGDAVDRFFIAIELDPNSQEAKGVRWWGVRLGPHWSAAANANEISVGLAERARLPLFQSVRIADLWAYGRIFD